MKRRPRVDWSLSEESVARYLCTVAFTVCAVWLISELRGIDSWLGVGAGVVVFGVPAAWFWAKHLDDAAIRKDKAENAGTGRTWGVIRRDKEPVGGASMGIGPGRDDVPHPQPSEGDEGEERYP